MSRTRRRRARILHARTAVAHLIAALARHCEAVVRDARSGIRAVFGADFARSARDAVTRILATRLALADANRGRDAVGTRRRARWSAQNRVVCVEYGLLRAIAAVVGDAVVALRHAVFASRHRFAALTRRAREFTRLAWLCAET